MYAGLAEVLSNKRKLFFVEFRAKNRRETPRTEQTNDYFYSANVQFE